MKIALCQLNFTIADIIGNTNKIIDSIKTAKSQHVDLVVFSELSICAYPPDDLLDYPHFVESCQLALQDIVKASENISVIVGLPTFNYQEKGRKLYNSACVIQNQKVLKTINKTLLPTYDIFNEARYFEPNKQFNLVEINGIKIALTICEDLWSNMDDFNYEINPLEELKKLNPDLAINISASPFNKGKEIARLKILQDQAKNNKLTLVYVNQVGAHSDILFDGHSLVLNAEGQIIQQLPSFQEAINYFDFDLEQKQTIDLNQSSKIETLHQALVFGLKNYYDKMGFKKAVLGSSGGIDSALVQALASEAIGAENVLAVLMPSEFSSEGSVLDAQKLSENLGNPFQIVPISSIFNAFNRSLEPVFKDSPFNITEENIQARSRAILLMAISNKLGHILLNTSNKSEMSVGYTTLYGDMCGSLSVIGDLYKTEVYELCKHINKNKEIIPNSIINKAPSAELRPYQKDSDSLPEYEILDQILTHYIENQASKEQIITLGFESELVSRIIKMVNNNEFKRFQAPPILRVSSKAFGRGRIIPLVSKW